MRYYGYEFALAWVVAFNLHLHRPSPESFARFAHECAFDLLPEACWRFLRLDLENPSCFDPMWERLDEYTSELMQQA